jgi:hypothetical protein
VKKLVDAMQGSGVAVEGAEDARRAEEIMARAVEARGEMVVAQQEWEEEQETRRRQAEAQRQAEEEAEARQRAEAVAEAQRKTAEEPDNEDNDEEEVEESTPVRVEKLKGGKGWKGK